MEKNGFYKRKFFCLYFFFELKRNMPKPKEFSLINPIIIKNILRQYSKFDNKIKFGSMIYLL